MKITLKWRQSQNEDRYINENKNGLKMETTPQNEDDLNIYTFSHYTLAIMLRLQIKSYITGNRCLSLAIAPLWLEIYNL